MSSSACPSGEGGVSVPSYGDNQHVAFDLEKSSPLAVDSGQMHGVTVEPAPLQEQQVQISVDDPYHRSAACGTGSPQCALHKIAYSAAMR
jgi:hypothetical protein